MALLNQDLSQVQEQNFDPIPPGEYQVKVTDSSVVTTKKGDPMLKVTFNVDAGPLTDRKVFDNFLLGNSVAMSRLKSLAIAANHPHPDFLQDSEELHGLRLLIKVNVKEDPNYPPKNNVTSFKKIAAVAGIVAPPAFVNPLAPLDYKPPLGVTPPATPPFRFQPAVIGVTSPLVSPAAPAPAPVSAPMPAPSSPPAPQPDPAPAAGSMPKMPWD